MRPEELYDIPVGRWRCPGDGRGGTAPGVGMRSDRRGGVNDVLRRKRGEGGFAGVVWRERDPLVYRICSVFHSVLNTDMLANAQVTFH